MKNFTQEIIRLSNEVRDLKTFGLTSSSSLALAEATVNLTFQIVGYTVNTQYDRCASSQTALIKLIPDDGKNMLSMATISAGSSSLTSRRVRLSRIVLDGMPSYAMNIVAGSNADLTAINNGQTIAPITFTLKFYATSDFTIDIQWRQDH